MGKDRNFSWTKPAEPTPPPEPESRPKRDAPSVIREHLAAKWTSPSGLKVLDEMIDSGSGAERISLLEQVTGKATTPITVTGQLDQRVLLAAAQLPPAVAEVLARLIAASTGESAGIIDSPAVPILDKPSVP